MSELPPLSSALPPTNEPLRIAVRRLRWFRSAFEAYMAAIGARIGCTYRIDDSKLAGIFVRWLRAVELQKPVGANDRHDFFEFAAGLMLRELTGDMPITATASPTKVDPDSAAAFWPEGYACTMFCLTVHSAAMQQEFQDRPGLSPEIDDLRHWWSFRENARMDAAFSAGFLQMLLGHQPNWMMPDVFRARLGQELRQPG
jgi:hypothetical protein